MKLATVGAPAAALRAGGFDLRSYRALLPWRQISLVTTCAGVITLPWLRPNGPGNTSPVDLFITLSVVSTLFWALSERLAVRMPYLVASAVISLAGIISSMFGAYEGTGLTSVVQDFVMLSWATAIVTVCRTAPGMRAVLGSWAYASIAAAAIMVVAALLHLDAIAGITAREGNRATLTMNDPNMAAGYFCISLMIVWASATPRRRMARWAGCLILVTAVVFTGSNGFSIATVLACIAAGTIGLARRKGVVPAAAMVCTVFFCGAVVITQANINALVQDAAGSAPLLRDYVGRSTQSAAGRDTLLHETLNLVHQGGLIGIGPSAVKPTLKATQAEVAFEAHSDYTASITERGFLGGVGLILLIATLAFHGRWSQARLPDGIAAALVRPGALIGGLVACAWAANVYELMHFRYVWTLFAIIAAVSIWGRKRVTT